MARRFPAVLPPAPPPRGRVTNLGFCTLLSGTAGCSARWPTPPVRAPPPRVGGSICSWPSRPHLPSTPSTRPRPMSRTRLSAIWPAPSALPLGVPPRAAGEAGHENQSPSPTTAAALTGGGGLSTVGAPGPTYLSPKGRASPARVAGRGGRRRRHLLRRHEHLVHAAARVRVLGSARERVSVGCSECICRGVRTHGCQSGIRYLLAQACAQAGVAPASILLTLRRGPKHRGARVHARVCHTSQPRCAHLKDAPRLPPCVHAAPPIRLPRRWLPRPRRQLAPTPRRLRRWLRRRRPRTRFCCRRSSCCAWSWTRWMRTTASPSPSRSCALAPAGVGRTRARWPIDDMTSMYVGN